MSEARSDDDSGCFLLFMLFIVALGFACENMERIDKLEDDVRQLERQVESLESRPG